MSTCPPTSRARPSPSIEGRLRLRFRFVLLLLSALLVLSAPLTAAATAQTAAGSASAASSTAVSDVPSLVQQATPVTNNSSVRHRNPEEVGSESQLEELQRLLGSRLSDRLGESAVEIDREQYERAEALLGEAYLSQLSKYADVADERDDANATDAVEAFNETRTAQQEYSRTVAEFRETYAAYQDARQSGNEDQARALAGELVGLRDEAARQSAQLEANYTDLSDLTTANLTTATEEIRTIQADINETSATVADEEFATTELRIREVDQRGSFSDPLSIAATLNSEDGPVADQSISIVIGAQTSTVRTNSEGEFLLTYRPRAVPANASTVSINYVPTSTSRYLPSNATIPVSLQAERGQLSLETTTDTAGFGESVAVSGAVEVDGTPVRNLSLTVAVGERRLGTVRTDANGVFRFTEPLPASVATGTRQLSVAPPVAGRAVDLPTRERPIEVRETATTVGATAIRTNGQLRLIGELTADGRPVPAQRIVVSVGDDRLGTVQTGPEGSFALTLDEDEAGQTVTVAFDGTGTNLQSAETRVNILDPAQSTPVDESTGASDESTIGLSAVLLGNVPLTLTTLIAVLTTPLGLVAGSLVLGLSGLVLALLVRRLRTPSRTSAGAGAPAAGGGGTPASTGRDEQPEPTVSLEAAEAALDAGSTDEAVIAAYGATRVALLSTLPIDRVRTHRQFLADCLAAGVGTDGIETLTELYERARYGADAVATSDAEAALAAARSMINASPDDPADD